MEHRVRWRTRDGRRLALSEMSDQHLMNTIAFLRRRKDEHAVRLLSAWGFFGMLQGEYAIYYAERDLDRMEEELAEMDAAADRWVALMLHELAGRALV